MLVSLLQAKLLQKSSWFLILKVSGIHCPATFLVSSLMIYGYQYYNSSLSDFSASILFIYRITSFWLKLCNDSSSIRWCINLLSLELPITLVPSPALHFSKTEVSTQNTWIWAPITAWDRCRYYGYKYRYLYRSSHRYR